jgi:peptidoglycan/LPS O-acetylase OafA/YrhL
VTAATQPASTSQQKPLSFAREEHVVPLDGLRGLAVLMVMFGHFWLAQKPVGAVQEWTYTFVQNGWVGVDLFFVLSGFLITGILLEAKGSTHYFRNFYARRILRIFPLYWGFLFVYFVILPRVISLAPGSPFATAPGMEKWFWLYASNMLSLVPGAVLPPGLNHFWSLAVEEQFYLIWPAIVFALSMRALERTCVALVVIAFAFRLFLLTTPFHHTGGYVLLPARIDTLAIGAWLAIIARDQARRELVERWAPKAFIVALIALAIANLPDLRMFGYRVSMQTVGFPLLAVMAASLISIGTGKTEKTGRIRRFFSSRILVTAGKYSYAMYVFHLPLVIVMDMVGFHMRTLSAGNPPGILAALGYSIIMSIATFVVALASWHLYEKHFLKLKRLFPRREALSSAT